MTRSKGLSFFFVGGVLFTPLSAQGTPSPNLDLAHHVARRVTFGPNTALIAQLATGTTAVQSYLSTQLNPPAVGAPNYHGSASVATLIAALPTTPGGSINNFMTSWAQVGYALESEWQLREVMTQFWERHFNTSLIQQKAYFTPYFPGAEPDYAWFFEWEANEFYRANCLTTFENLLSFTAHHASMMIYLHMPQNNGSNPNEDFARELCELYTMSPEQIMSGGGTVKNYDQNDIESVARILTGWDVDEANGFVFQFDDPDHAYSPTATTLFGISGSTVTIPLVAPPNGLTEGTLLLQALASRPATAEFVCRKMIREFVDETLAQQPTSPLLQAMTSAWGGQGDIKAVMIALLTSNEFQNTAAYRLNRVRLPIEAAVASARAMDASIKLVGGLPDPNSLTGMLVTMYAQGMSLLEYPAPNGFPTYVSAQLSPSIALERAYWGFNVLLGTPAESPATDVITFVASVQPPLPSTPTVSNVGPHFLAVTDHMLTSFYGGNYTLSDELRVIDAALAAKAYYDAQPTGPWDPANPSHYQGALLAMAASALGMVQSGQR